MTFQHLEVCGGEAEEGTSATGAAPRPWPAASPCHRFSRISIAPASWNSNRRSAHASASSRPEQGIESLTQVCGGNPCPAGKNRRRRTQNLHARSRRAARTGQERMIAKLAWSTAPCFSAGVSLTPRPDQPFAVKRNGFRQDQTRVSWPLPPENRAFAMLHTETGANLSGHQQDRPTGRPINRKSTPAAEPFWSALVPDLRSAGQRPE